MKHFKMRSYWLAVLAVCFFVSLAQADTVKLKNGRTVEGRYLGGTDSQITFYSGGELQHFPISDIKAITFGDESSSIAAPAPAPSTAQPAPTAHAAAARPATPPKAVSLDSHPSENAGSSTASSSTSQTVLVPEGTVLSVRMIDSVDSSTNNAGDTFRASLDEPLMANGNQVAPKGTTVYGELEDVKQSGNLKGQSELRLVLTSIIINNATYKIATGDYQVQGQSRGHQTAERAGVGAALGGLIGAIAGGGKGAAIGAGVGAGAGTATQVITHGQQVHVPSETVLNFTIRQPVTLPVSTSSTPAR